jgi:hypothetical protein
VHGPGCAQAASASRSTCLTGSSPLGPWPSAGEQTWATSPAGSTRSAPESRRDGRAQRNRTGSRRVALSSCGRACAACSADFQAQDPAASLAFPRRGPRHRGRDGSGLDRHLRRAGQPGRADQRDAAGASAVLQRKDRQLHTEAFDRLMADAIPSAAVVKMAANPAGETAGMPPRSPGFTPEMPPKGASHQMAASPNRIRNEETPANARVLRMELAGLEPATSWVRFGRPTCSNGIYLQGFCDPTAWRGPIPIPYVAGDSRELRPQNRLCGLNPGRHPLDDEELVATGRGDDPRVANGSPARSWRCCLSTRAALTRGPGSRSWLPLPHGDRGTITRRRRATSRRAGRRPRAPAQPLGEQVRLDAWEVGRLAARRRDPLPERPLERCGPLVELASTLVHGARKQTVPPRASSSARGSPRLFTRA